MCKDSFGRFEPNPSPPFPQYFTNTCDVSSAPQACGGILSI